MAVSEALDPTPRLSLASATVSTTLDVFISSKMQELKPERDALFALLKGLDYGDIKLNAWVFEQDAPASSRTIRDIYLRALQNSALYIGLLWNEFGDGRLMNSNGPPTGASRDISTSRTSTRTSEHHA